MTTSWCIALVSLLVFGGMSVKSEDFLIITDLITKTIQTNPIGTLGDVQSLTTISLQGVDVPVAVDYDPIDQKFYWTDTETDVISRAFLNGTEQEVVVTLSNASNSDGIALDIENRQLFWTDSGTGTIEMANMDGSGKQVLLQGLDTPRSIIADSAGRYIYWSDWGSSPKIERANFDGTERLILVDSDIQWPNGIAIDFVDGRLFWIDAGKNRLESVDLQGENREVIVDYMDNPDIHPFDIALYMNSLYWTDWFISSIVEIGKSGTPEAAPVGPSIDRPTGIHIHQDNDGSCSTNICENGGRCRQLITGYQCVCLTGFNGTFCEQGEGAMTTQATTTSVVTTPLPTTAAAMTSEATTTSVVTTPLPTTSAATTTLAATTTAAATTMLKTTYKDLEPPTLVCSQVQAYAVNELEVSVRWQAPSYKDNSGISGSMNSTHKSPSTFGIGVHEVTYTAWDSSGNIASCSVTITVIAACPGDKTTGNTTQLTWPLTAASNESVFSSERCNVSTQNRGNGLADRVCMRDQERGAVWLNPNYLGCGEQDEPDLGELAETEVVESNAEDVATGLKETTQGKDNLTTEDVANVAKTVTNIGNAESDSPEVTITIVEIADILVTTFAASDEEEDAEGVVADDAGEDTSAASFLSILEAIEEQVERSTGNGQSFNTTTPTIAIVTTTLGSKQGSPSGLTFVVLANDDDEEGDDFREEDIQTLGSEEDIPEDEEARTSISLPTALFNTSGNGTIGVSFVVHNSDLLFPTNSTNRTVRVGSDVISAIVVGVVSVHNLPEPVIIQFTVSGSDPEPSCVFWDFDLLDWSTDGCELEEYKTGRVTCHCNHLTNFAVLVDPSYEDTHVFLDIASKIGCAVSMVALLITVVIFVAFRRLRIGSNRVPRLILLNLCVALFLLYLVFLVGIDSTSDKGGCIFVAFLLQFLTLASLCWMGVEAANLYLKIVRIFDSEPPNFLLKASIAAWGLPLLVTVISFGAGFDYYDHNEYCFVGTGPPLFFGLVLPIAIILFFNLVMFSRVMHRLCTVNVAGRVTNKSYSDKVRQRLQNAFAMSALMGLTWVFGFFAIEEAKFAFSLIFCLCNSLQGLVLFLLFCARPEDVRQHLRPYFVRLCGLSPTSQSGSETASTKATNSTSTLKSPKSNASTYSASDFSVTLPMSPTTTDEENTGNDDVTSPITTGTYIANATMASSKASPGPANSNSEGSNSSIQPLMTRNDNGDASTISPTTTDTPAIGNSNSEGGSSATVDGNSGTSPTSPTMTVQSGGDSTPEKPTVTTAVDDTNSKIDASGASETIKDTGNVEDDTVLAPIMATETDHPDVCLKAEIKIDTE